MEAFRLIMNDRRFDAIPLILETPNPEEWPTEIRLLYSLSRGNSAPYENEAALGDTTSSWWAKQSIMEWDKC
jgi:hypothetical protein